MREDERCIHPDCIYRAKYASDKGLSVAGNCNYMAMNGKSRIAGLPDRLQLPCNCPEYVPNVTDPELYKQKTWQDKALALYNAGATDREIAQACGKESQRVGEWRRKLGLPLHPDRKGTDPRFDWKQARELYRRGYNDREIAEALGCGVSTVWRWRFKYELFPNDHGGRKRKGEKK